jgi:hypothetical protein
MVSTCFLIPEAEFDLSWVKAQVRGTDTVLPIGLRALALCKSQLSNVFSVEDFVSYDEIVQLAIRANDMAQLTSSRFCGGATLDGYDWPAICWYTQLYFFRDILLAETLALRLKERGFEKILWLGRRGQRPGYYLATSDTVQCALSFHLGNRFQILQTRVQPVTAALDRYRGKLSHGIVRVRKCFLDRNPRIQKSQGLAFFAVTEWERFTDALNDLCLGYGEEFQLWFLGRIPDKLEAWTRSIGLRSVRIPYPNYLEKDVSAFFEEQWESWVISRRHVLADETGCQVLSSDLLQYHFAFYFQRFWPRMAQWGRRIERYLSVARPCWVIGSAAYSHEVTMPYHVASKLGITTIVLPHAAIPGGHGKIKSSFLACRSQFERENFRRPFPDDSRVLYCRNACNEVSYRPNSVGINSSQGRQIVAFLTAEPESADSFLLSVHRSAFVDAFAGILSPPDDLSDLEIVIKSHPRHDVSGLLRTLRVRESPNVVILDPRASIMDLIRKSWIVVLCNHYGSVAVQAVMSSKPIIFFDSARNAFPYIEKLAYPAGELVEDIQSLWGLLRHLRDSSERYQDLCKKCQRFKEENLQPAEQTLVECIRRMEADRVSTAPNPVLESRPFV